MPVVVFLLAIPSFHLNDDAWIRHAAHNAELAVAIIILPATGDTTELDVSMFA